MLIEVSGPMDIWGECGRMFSMGDPSNELRKAFEDSAKLQKWTAGQSIPGARPSEIFTELNKQLAAMGYAIETRIFAHGQSYDIVDRPIYTTDETMILEENMFVALHPICANKEASCYNCDNFVIKKDGAVKLNKTPTELIVL